MCLIHKQKSKCRKQTITKGDDIMSCSVLYLAKGFRGHLEFITISDGPRGGVEAGSNATFSSLTQTLDELITLHNNVSYRIRESDNVSFILWVL